MEIPSVSLRPSAAFVVCLILTFSSCTPDRSGTENYTAASSSYGILAEKSLDLLARLDLDTWGTMLSDSVVYYFPDGDIKNSKKVAGKTALLDWWKNYITISGMKSMSIENASYVPIHVEQEQRSGERTGTQVIAYFSNKMVYDQGEISVKMNFVIHFDKNKLIDGYYTYYDRTPIIQLLKDKNIPEAFATKLKVYLDKPDNQLLTATHLVDRYIKAKIRFVVVKCRAGLPSGHFVKGLIKTVNSSPYGPPE